MQGQSSAGTLRLVQDRARRPRLLGFLVFAITALAIVACQPSALNQATTVKIVVEADGIYQVSAQALRAVGFDLATAPPEELSLSSGGEPVGFALLGQGKNRVLRFYGRALGPQAYTAQNVYWLSRAASADPVTVAARPAAPTGVAASNVVTATVRAEEQSVYHGQAGPSEDRWVWQAISAPAEASVTLAVPEPTAGRGLLRVQVIGDSTAQVTPNHHLVLSLNDTAIADETWDGMGLHVITATVPAATVHPGENHLTLAAPGDTGAPADVVLLDWVELAYPRDLSLAGGELTFGGAASGYRFRADDEIAALWDITDAARPVALTDYATAGGVVHLAADGTARQFIAVTEARLRSPAAVVAADPARALHTWPGGADMILVTVPQFREALKPLVAAREAQGLRVAVVDVDQAYDSFSAGRAGPEAIRALVQHAQAHWTPPAPRFLLLAGDASYDPRGYLGGSQADLVPTQEVSTSFSGWTASDVWFGLADDGAAAVPTLAVGRFPAQTADQLAAMVAKTLSYEQNAAGADWRKDVLLIADNDEPGFEDLARQFAGELNNHASQVIAVQGDGGSARQALLQAFGDGAGLIGYFGHGSVTLWAQEKILGVDDVSQLSNRDRLPIIFTVTCLSGLFEHPTTSSLGEALLRAKDGGTVAGLVPSSAAMLPDQRVLAMALAAALAQTSDDAPKTLGEMVLRAQTSINDASPNVRQVLLTFNLLGDPALSLDR